WMPITIFKNENGKLTKTDVGLNDSNGFWTCVEMADLDQDGDLDLVLGNHGKNTRLQASMERPVEMYINDYDQNGTAEQILTAYNGDKSYPFALRHDLVMQLPNLKKKYLKYEAYQNATIDSIFTAEQINSAVHLTVKNTATSIALNQGDGTFKLAALPLAAQLSPTYGIAVDDFDNDGHLDILLGGNFYRSKPEVGIYDASYGTFLRGDGKGNFVAVPNAESGFFVKGEIRDILIFKNKKQRQVVVARNNDTIKIFDF
ncbi:MAG: FG-GAP repeat domain-containing protein, partial [Saprospiraceae bacterium]